MIIKVRATPNSNKNELVKDDNIYKVYLTCPARDGKANKLLIKILAKHFSISKTQIKIVKGNKSRDKIIEIIE
ncbi:MAG: DUF167 domain-containing protein [Candidatus Aenigmarchaeota archaeon]|nr:DUF167 domain-containing protein [Candidatus Aenigmarchaeota archaeon]